MPSRLAVRLDLLQPAWRLARCGLLSSRRTLLTNAAESAGPSEPPLLTRTIPEHFASIVSEHGNRAAVISHHQRTTFTYRELDARSNALARGLRQRGVAKGDRVAVSLGNNLEFATLTYAVFKLGAVLVPLNPAFNAPQIVAALDHLKATCLVIGAETHVPHKHPRSNIDLVKSMVGIGQGTTGVASLRQAILVDNSSGRTSASDIAAFESYEDLHGDQPSANLADTNLGADDVINIQFTSGTTSTPKAACLTHRSILNNGFFIGERMLLTPKDIICCPPPLFHCFGSVLGYMASCTHGSSIVFPSEVFSAASTLSAVSAHSCTALYGVPTMFLAELDLLAHSPSHSYDLSQLRTGIAAGSSIPAELMRKLHRTLNLTDLTICYGMTETSPVSCMTTTTDPLHRRISTVGRPLPHVSTRVVDPLDPSRILPRDQRGELLVSGYLLMKAYFADPSRTAETIYTDATGRRWIRTGDEASIDEEGYVCITGRIKDLIIRGGENIHPLEIESCILELDGVYEVSVVGLPDSRYGEVVAAFVVRKGGAAGAGAAAAPKKGSGPSGTDSSVVGGEAQAVTEDEIRNHVARRLSRHLVPKHVFWIDAFPKTPSGKIMKYRLREMGVDLLRAPE